MTDINEVAVALTAAQKQIETPKQDSINPHFKSKYAGLQSVLDAVIPALNAHDIALTQQTKWENERLLVVTKLIHKSGQYIESVYPVLPIQDTPQGYGSALTYARRYSLSAIVGVASEPDDDANEASKAPKNADQRFTDEIKKAFDAKEVPPPAARKKSAPVVINPPPDSPTFIDVIKAIEKAETLEDLDAAADLARTTPMDHLQKQMVREVGTKKRGVLTDEDIPQ